jgi:hypothetical protein
MIKVGIDTFVSSSQMRAQLVAGQFCEMSTRLFIHDVIDVGEIIIITNDITKTSVFLVGPQHSKRNC